MNNPCVVNPVRGGTSRGKSISCFQSKSAMDLQDEGLLQLRALGEWKRIQIQTHKPKTVSIVGNLGG
jgi:hypothetical protein